MLLVNKKQVDKKFDFGGLFRKLPLSRKQNKARNHFLGSSGAGPSFSEIPKSSVHNNGTVKVRNDCQTNYQSPRDPSAYSSGAEQIPFSGMDHHSNGYREYTNYDYNDVRYNVFHSECVSLQDSEMTMEDRFETGARGSENEDLDQYAEDNDITTCLSDSDSDLEFNPRMEEDIKDYYYGGYHPVFKGEVYYSNNLPCREYIAMRKLGWGHFSTVWLAKARFNPSLSPENADKVEDKKDRYVALKFVKSDKHYLEATEDEIKILKTLNQPLVFGKHLRKEHKTYFDKYEQVNHSPVGHSGFDRIMKFFDSFDVGGPNGRHICMVFEVLGESALNLIYKFKRLQSSLSHKPFHDPMMSKVLNGNIDHVNGYLHRAREIDSDLGLKLGAKNSECLVKSIQESKSGGGLPINVVKQVVKQLFIAVDYMHHCGVIHTDLKPENILLQIESIDEVLRSFEEDKISESRAKHQKNNGVKARQLSVTSTLSGGGAYKKSKNSISCKNRSPIRASKPLEFSTFSCGSVTRENLKSSGSNNFPFAIKIADMGNATFTNFHFTNHIQTRQYRSPEIILRYKQWGSSTDLWSIGCIIFELLTGDFLFDPHNGTGFDKDDDHLAQIIELLGYFPPVDYLRDCEFASKYFKVNPATSKVELKHIDTLKFWSLEEVLVTKYKFESGSKEVKLVTDLILKCLTFSLEDRYDCNSLLQHPWLIDNYDIDLNSLKTLPNGCAELPGFISTS